MLGFLRKLVYKVPVSKAVQEAALEIIRLAVMAGISAVVASLVASVSAVEPTMVTILLLAGLRSTDKWLYVRQKENGTTGTPNGLLGV